MRSCSSCIDHACCRIQPCVPCTHLPGEAGLCVSAMEILPGGREGTRSLLSRSHRCARRVRPASYTALTASLLLVSTLSRCTQEMT